MARLKLQFFLMVLITLCWTILFSMLFFSVWNHYIADDELFNLWEGLHPNYGAMLTFLIGMCCCGPIVGKLTRMCYDELWEQIPSCYTCVAVTNHTYRVLKTKGDRYFGQKWCWWLLEWRNVTPLTPDFVAAFVH